MAERKVVLELVTSAATAQALSARLSRIQRATDPILSDPIIELR